MALHAVPVQAAAAAPAVNALIACEKSDAMPSKKYRIGYLTQCVDRRHARTGA